NLPDIGRVYPNNQGTRQQERRAGGSSMNTSLKVGLAAALIGTAFAPSLAGAQVYVRVGPPRPIYERRPPPPRPGWAWQAGYHRWDGRRYVWVPGAYVA